MKENLRIWLDKNPLDANLIFGKQRGDQCIFVMNDLMNNLFLNIASDYDFEHKSFEENAKIQEEFVPSVVGEHYSKSVILPVMEMDLSKIGLKIVLRCNFYNWCISVESENEIDCDFMGLITDESGCFEGFPRDRIYEGYSKTNNKNFSLTLRGRYDVYTFMYILRNWAVSYKSISEKNKALADEHKVEFNIKVTMKDRWVNDFCSMLKWMESCGNMGHSSVTAFYSDGDGDFRPKFEFDREYEKTEGYWCKDKELPKPEVIFDAG